MWFGWCWLAGWLGQLLVVELLERSGVGCYVGVGLLSVVETIVGCCWLSFVVVSRWGCWLLGQL